MEQLHSSGANNVLWLSAGGGRAEVDPSRRYPLTLINRERRRYFVLGTLQLTRATALLTVDDDRRYCGCVRWRATQRGQYMK
jgi:hypothetical protein